MKKATYMRPQVVTHELETMQMMASSLTGQGNGLDIRYGGSASENNVSEADANRNNWDLW